jgi:Stress responsive A/B Barrel Domain
MIRHVVMFRWTAEATGEQKRQVAAELRRLPALLPVLRAYHVGADLGMAEGNFEFAVVADFDDLEGWQEYRDHPEHRDIIVRFIQPIAAQRAAVQYQF